MIPPDGSADEGRGTAIGTRLRELRARVEAAARKAGRDPDGIEIMAVSKFNPVAAVEAAFEAGIRSFGESRVQEAEEKFPVFLRAHPEVRLDLVGHLQSNKVKKALGLFSRLQSVDSPDLIREIRKRGEARREAGLGSLEILFELHTAEDSKTGFPDAASIHDACRLIAETEGGDLLLPRGLMTIAPNMGDESAIRGSFAKLRELSAEIRREWAFPRFDVLSMGMSGDFEIAVEEGSTLIRIGTAIFGERKA
jgi:pyridoxal phosphate enzyme (YggS family)